MAASGKWALLVLMLALAGLGVWKWRGKIASRHAASPVPVEASSPAAAGQPGANATADAPHRQGTTGAGTDAPSLAPAGTYQPTNNIVDIELSEYAGYAGMIVANGGLEPTESSEFFKKGGFKVRLTLKEEESRSALNAGQIGALATTVDVLPIYGRQFHVTVPAQIGFSRGADGVVVRRDIKRINNLKGRLLATAQFTEGDFFIRFLAQEAGLGINILPGLTNRPNPDNLNLFYCEDAFLAGDLFLKDIQNGSNLLAGCVTWAPKTTEVAQQSAGRAVVLVSSLNLLIIADVLVVNKGFAQHHPEKVAALVAGLLEGNRQVRDNQNACLDIVAKAFKWDREKAKTELGKVHLSNLPENLAFFADTLESGGSYGGIYQMAARAYGKHLSADSANGAQFPDPKPLAAAESSGAFKDQKVAISPIRLDGSAPAEGPLLSKDVRFLFEPNSFTLRIELRENQTNLEAIKQLLQISPGATVLLRGHVDNAMAGEFRKKGGEKFVRQMALKAMELSQHRALEIKRLLIERYDLDAARLEAVGRGWDEPTGADQEGNRRVEAQWFTVP